MIAFRNWLRRFLSIWTILACAILLACEGWIYWSRWYIGFDVPDLLQLRDKIAMLILAASGLFRIIPRHPVYVLGYRRWLAQTPWRRGKPLPLGPIHLVPQDAIPVVLVYLVLHDIQVDPWTLPLVFLATYLIALCDSLFATGVWRHGYALAFGLGLAVLFLPDNAPMAFAVTLVLYGVALFGLRHSLDRFPWLDAPGRPWLKRQKDAYENALLFNAVERPHPSKLGWPFGVVGPFDPGEFFRKLDAALLSLLAGWWMYALMSVAPRHDKAAFAIPVVFGLLYLLVWRLATYLSQVRSPLSFRARIVTRRWIIPGYDEVFVAPAVAVFFGILLLSLLDGISVEYYAPATASLILFTLLAGGPSLRRFRLTGSHRCVPGGLNKNEFVDQ